MHRTGSRKVIVSFTAGRLTHFGGVYLLHRFLQQLQIRTFLGRQLYTPERNNHFSLTERLLALLYPMILGLNTIELSERLKRGQVPFLGRPRGFRVDSSPKLFTVFCTHTSSPNGFPR